jgi:hypothetical protein
LFCEFNKQHSITVWYVDTVGEGIIKLHVSNDNANAVVGLVVGADKDASFDSVTGLEDDDGGDCCDGPPDSIYLNSLIESFH